MLVKLEKSLFCIFVGVNYNFAETNWEKLMLHQYVLAEAMKTLNCKDSFFRKWILNTIITQWSKLTIKFKLQQWFTKLVI